MDDFPVFTRKVHTDVSYLACARKLLAAPDAVYPQFATHNAQTLASVMTMAGPNFYRGQYEFQCLHGMGEPLYEEVVGRDKLDRPCRVYAPVGSHETLLAYLVRRLLENGANTSFVNRIADASVAVDDLVADPVAVASTIQPLGAPARKDRPAPPSLWLATPQLARARLFGRAAPRRTRRGAGAKRQGASARLSAGRSARRQGRAGQQPRRSFRHRRACAPCPPGRDRRGDRRRRGGRASLGRRPAERARGDPAPRRREARRPQRRTRRPHRPRGRKVLRQRGRGSARGLRFPALLRGRGGPDARPRLSRAARRRRLHQPVELPAGDLHRPGRGGARGRQRGRRQAGRGDAADRRRGGARAARGGRPGRGAGASFPARARSGRRSSRIRACRASSSPARRRSRG